MPEWRRVPLDWMLAKRFSFVMRPADKIEAYSSGHSPLQSLLYGIQAGPCWAAMVGDSVVPAGVWGWTQRGAVWSYWRNLDVPEQRELLKRTPEMIREMVSDAGLLGIPTLSNMVWEDNLQALAWLKSSKCFNIGLDVRVQIGNNEFIPFETKPLEELPGV